MRFMMRPFREWTHKLKEACDDAGIEYFTAPYDLAVLDHLDSFVAAWKIGSGDITWHELIDLLSRKEKPVLIASGASNMNDVKSAMDILSKNKKEIVLMQLIQTILDLLRILDLLIFQY